jgi:hypothetical protein
MSRKKAITTVNELLELKLLTKQVRRKSNTENDSNVYEVNIPSVQDTPPSEYDTLTSVQDTPNKELPNNNYIKKDIGKFDEQTPAITFNDLIVSTNVDIDDMVVYYIDYYVNTSNSNPYYKYMNWLEIVNNLDSYISSLECHDVKQIVNRYLNTKFNQPHSLYHSSLENILSNRIYECGLM